MLAALVLTAHQAKAQFSISKVTPDSADTKVKPLSIKALGSSVNNPYFSEAKAAAERRKLRKQRNTTTLELGLNITQTKFDNWAAGGANTFSGLGLLKFNHQYKKESVALTTSFESRYGMQVIDGVVSKNMDFFNSSFTASRNFSKNWAYSGNIGVRSQWSKGYRTPTDKVVVSNIFSPGYVTFGLGFTYQALKKFPLRLTINALNNSNTVVLNDSLSNIGAYGVDPGKKIKMTFGSSIKAELKQPIYKDKVIYTLYAYYSTNYEQNNYVEWHNTLQYNLTKVINLQAFTRMLYNEPQKTPYGNPLQWFYSFNIGIGYTFKNK